jgi:hypothetical protein
MLRNLNRWAAVLGLLFVVGIMMVYAQDTPAVPEQTQEPPVQALPLAVNEAQPTQVTSGEGGGLVIIGVNFTPQTQVALSNVGTLQSSFVNATTLAAVLPAGLPPGAYTLQLSDPVNGSATLLNPIQVLQVTATGTATTQPAATQPTEPLTITRTEPGQITTGQAVTLSVLGTGFSSTSTVRLVGFGFLETTFVNSQALTASVPAGLPPGQYGVEVSDPPRGTVGSPNSLNVVQPTTTPAQLPTFEPPTAIPTVEPPTPVPGQPSLIVRNFVSTPTVVQPGDMVELRFEIVNQGNRPAQGIAVSVGAEGQFVPANGQATATIGDIQPGGSATVTLNVIASMSAEAGPNSVPISMSYRDFSGESYTSSATVSVEVGESAEASQVVLVRYSTQPDPVEPGQRIIVDVLVMNTGTEVARQVLLRIAGEDGLLLPGLQGDSFALGDIAPQESKNLSVPMVVGMDAEAGPQAQPITLSWLQDAETQESAGSITVDVARVIEPEPVILLQSYSTGEELLEPGDSFTLDLMLRNVGNADASSLLITFGTVDAQSGGGSGDSGSGDSGGDTGSGTGTGSSGGGSTTTTGIADNAFATIGSGSTLYAGDLPASGELNIMQQFVVNGTVESGIYSIPVTVRYTTDEGETEQLTLPASVIVIAPPQLQVALASPLPETANAGEPLPVSLNIANTGEDAVTVTVVNVTGENGEIMEGAETTIGSIAADDDASVNALMMPSAEGPFSITFTLHYRDDLNQMRTLDFTYPSEAVQPPPPPEEPFPPETAPVVEEPEEDNSLGRLLLGFLGLGG